MDLIKLLANLDSKKLEFDLRVQDATLGSREEYESEAFIYEKILYVMRKVYLRAKAMYPNHPLVKKLHHDDIEEDFSLGAPSYDYGE